MLAMRLLSGKRDTSLFNNVITLLNPNPLGLSASDYFGYAVALSRDYAVISAPLEDDAGTDSGKVYVFNVNNGSLVRTFNNPNPYGSSDYDYFGRSVSVYDDIVIVGSYNQDEANATNSGKAYIFSISSGNLLFILNNPNIYGTAENDYFGIHVAVYKNRLIVGAYCEDENKNTNSGKAYIFDTVTGSLLFILDNPNAYGKSKDDYFGWSVDISENYAIVGAYGEDESKNLISGKAYVFDIQTGLLVTTLNNPNAYSTAANDYFGHDVAIDGDYAVVSAYREDDGGIDSGKVYVFNVTNGALLHTINNPNPSGLSTNDYFGYSIDIDGNNIVVGAYQEDSGGKAYIFNRINGALIATLNNPNVDGTAIGDSFGRNVSIFERRVLIGAHGESDSGGSMSGKAYIFY